MIIKIRVYYIYTIEILVNALGFLFWHAFRSNIDQWKLEIKMGTKIYEHIILPLLLYIIPLIESLDKTKFVCKSNYEMCSYIMNTRKML